MFTLYEARRKLHLYLSRQRLTLRSSIKVRSCDGSIVTRCDFAQSEVTGEGRVTDLKGKLDCYNPRNNQ